MHKPRERRFSSMTTDETNSDISASIESACLPIGCSVSAKYRGAFCSAQVKTVDREIKVKVTLIDTGDIITISEEQIVQPVSLRIGNIVTIRLSTLNRHDEKQATIKQIYDNSIYTVVFNDGDEKSLRRSSLCLQGIRLYQTQIGQQKLLEDIPTSSSTSLKPSLNSNDLSSIVAVQRHGIHNKHVFPALILKRKSLADYVWVKSFLDGREYIVHKRDDIQTFKNNSTIQTLCRSKSIQATKACEKFIRYNQIPKVWQKKKRKTSNNVQNNNNKTDSDSHSTDTDDDECNEQTTEEKDSFVAKLFAFLDDRGTPINNIPKVHNYDLDLYRLFKTVRMLGGYNKVTKNDQWNKVYIKMGLPDELSSKTSRSIENAYKKYLFAYEDLLKKLGTIDDSRVYLSSRTSINNDSRQRLIRVRQKSESKQIISQQIKSRKRCSVDSKQNQTTKKPQTIIRRRKNIILRKSKSSNVILTSSSDSDSSNDETTKSDEQQTDTNKKSNSILNEKKKSTGMKTISSSSSLIIKRTTPPPIQRTKSTNDAEFDMKPVIKIPKISYEILKDSTFPMENFSKTQLSNNQDNPTVDESNNDIFVLQNLNTCSLSSEEIIETIKDDGKPLLSALPEQSDKNSLDETTETKVFEIPSIFQTIMESTDHQQTNEIENSSLKLNKRLNSTDNSKIDEQLFPLKRPISSEENLKNSTNISLTYDDISINDILLVQSDLNRKNQYHGKCIEKNNQTNELRIHYKELNSKFDEWIKIDRVVKRQVENDLNDEEKSVDLQSPTITINEQEKIQSISIDHEDKKKDFATISSNDKNRRSSCSSISNNREFNNSTEQNCEKPISINNNENDFEIIDDNESSHDTDQHIQSTISRRRSSNEKVNLTKNILSTSEICFHRLPIEEQNQNISTTIQQSISVPNSPSDQRRTTIRPKRRILRDPNNTSLLPKKRPKFDTDSNSNFNIDNINNSDLLSSTSEQQSGEIKRNRTVTKRGGRRTVVNQQDNEIDEIHVNSPINITLRQQLEDMFKNRNSRYNFLDLNNNLTGDSRLAHLKDRMRQCQKVFFNLKSALKKIEKQRKLYIRRQKPSIVESMTNDVLIPSTCTLK